MAMIGIFQSWPRDPDGPFLNKHEKPPIGKRTPNGIIWGEDLSDFYWVERKYAINLVTCWSRSMLDEYGENFANFPPEELSDPRPRRPWPLLTLPDENNQRRTIAPIDELLPYRAYLKDLDHDDVGKDGRALDKMAVDEPRTAVDASGLSAIEKGKGKEAVPTPPPKEDVTMHNLPPNLEEFIPKAFLPDVLIVHDHDNITRKLSTSNARTKTVVDNFLCGKPLKYIRVVKEESDFLPPELEQEEEVSFYPNAPPSPRVAHLQLHKKCFLGQGHHSDVYLAPLRLPEPLGARTPTGEVSVACKMARPAESARALLDNEGDIYARFPKHLQEEWTGLNLVPPIKMPVPVCPVVPKFFGYYKPVVDDTILEGAEESLKDKITVWVEGLTPILLLEHCGTPIEPSKFSMYEKYLCYTQLLRLHIEEFTQGSYFSRNILVQPGPLTIDPSERSLCTPSFRIIDFGRARSLKAEEEERNEEQIRWIKSARNPLDFDAAANFAKKMADKEWLFGEDLFHEKSSAMKELNLGIQDM
ncbi:hypothetical protein OF83DRAFT_1169479 [Amylostereum chailletii]|nr:hypothetical protein OF83DRAFT_1169479 [Amylostereum chailletii]